MSARKIAVLSAGNSGYGMVADLTIAGYKVHLYENRDRFLIYIVIME